MKRIKIDYTPEELDRVFSDTASQEFVNEIAYKELEKKRKIQKEELRKQLNNLSNK